MWVKHEHVELFFSLFLVLCRDYHAAGVNAHHRSRRQVHYGNERLSDELFRLVESVDTAQ